MNRVSMRIILFVSLISLFVALPFFLLEKQNNDLLNVYNQEETSDIARNVNSDTDLFNDDFIYDMNPLEDVSYNSTNNVNSDNITSKNDNVEGVEISESISTQTVRVVFYETNYPNAKEFTKYEILDNIKMLSKVDDNDGLYTVAEYFRDISFGELKLEFSYGTRFYDDNLDNQNVFYSNLDYDITINWYPIKAFKTSDKFWPMCLSGIRSVVLSKNVDVSTICHEMIHTFKISDLYSNKTDKNGCKYDYVGGWDIMSFNCYKNPQFPLVNTIGYVRDLTTSNYFDMDKSNIEVLDKTSNVTIKATSYASKEDTIAIKIQAKDLGFNGDYYQNIYFMIEYRKANGLKDKTNPYGDDCLIIYRVNNNYWSNVEVENQGRTFVYIYRKYNSSTVQNAGLIDGDTFGSKTSQGYNTIFMPNGDNTKIVISNIKFGSDGECSFKVELPTADDNVSLSGTISNRLGCIAKCELYENDVKVLETDSNGCFYLNTVKGAIITFKKDGVVVKSLIADKSYKGVLLYTDDVSCKIIIKNDVSGVKVSINNKILKIDATSFDLMLNVGDKVRISCVGYKDYEFAYNNEKRIEITLSEPDKPNIIDRTTDNIQTNAGKLVDAINNITDLIEKGLSNLPDFPQLF